MKKLILLFTFFSIFTFGQFTEKTKGTYQINLYSVEEKGIEKILESNIFSNEIFDITWKYNFTDFSFVLINKSNDNLKINWNNISLIDQFGENLKIFHSGIKFIDREKEQVETTIYKNSKISDIIAPIKNVYYQTGNYGGWKQSQILKVKAQTFGVYQFYDSQVDNSTIRIAFPLIINNVSNEYIFTFKVKFLEKTNKN